MTVLDQIKRNAVPAPVMRSAAKGALPVKASEMLEILVYLTRNPVFAQDAKMTLAQWDAVSAVEILADPAAPPDVLGYFWAEANRRPVLMPTLIENPAISENLLMEMAATGREMAALLLSSPRARSSPAVAEALAANPGLTPEELRELRAEPPPTQETNAVGDTESDAAHQSWHQEHAAEIAAEEGKPFALTGTEDEPAAPAAEAFAVREATIVDVSTNLAAAALAAAPRAKAAPLDEKKLTILQKLAKMKAADRVKAAFSGGRDERLILIRDGARVVQNAVLASPKLTDPEVETFAAAKNVSENVMREIARNRRFMKNYSVVRNLVNNPKCPLDLSLTLIKNLMVYDLKSLRYNKSVPETIRQVAAKLYREKSGPAREAKR
ncbi:MAG TPA: hypothetical protein VIX19_18445 [Terriglobales bacterium]